MKQIELTDEMIDQIIKWGKELEKIKNTSQFRLPTKEEFENLIDHFSRWNKEKKGLEILNKEGNTLFFPASGRCNGTSEVGFSGYYWSSTESEKDNGSAHCFYFDSGTKKTNCFCCNYGRSIRLVSNEPFEGSIEFDDLYWKSENENGYFTFNEATSKFNQK